MDDRQVLQSFIKDDLAIFTVVALFNMGACYQSLSLQSSRSLYLVRARKTYELALKTWESMSNDECLQSTVRGRGGGCMSSQQSRRRLRRNVREGDG